LRAASIAPAPAPKGNANSKNHHIELESEKPSKDMVEVIVLTAVTWFVPNLFISLAAKRLEITVPSEIREVTKLAYPIGRFISGKMAGHAEPKSESGSPKPIYIIDIIIKSSVNIYSP
jgi:hypothetical protein